MCDKTCGRGSNSPAVVMVELTDKFYSGINNFLMLAAGDGESYEVYF